VVEEVERGSGRAVAVAADVSSEDDVRAMFERVQETLGGPVDLLVNNAGVEYAVGTTLFMDGGMTLYPKFV